MSIPSAQPIKRFVRAGAGAGKTWTLTRQVIALALNHKEQTGQWPKTILTTFTRKATQELKERLMLYSLQEKPEAIEFVQATSFLTITTIHGLFSLFLKRYGIALGLPNQFKIIDGRKAEFWRKQILKDLLSENREFKSLQNYGIRTLLEYLKSYEPVYWNSGIKPVDVQSLQRLTDERAIGLAIAIEASIRAAETTTDCEKWQEYFNRLQSICDVLQRQLAWDKKAPLVSASLEGLVKPRKSKNNPGISEDLEEEIKETLGQIKDLLGKPQYAQKYWEPIADSLEEFQKFAQHFMNKLVHKKLSEASLEPDDLEFFSQKLLLEKPDVLQKFSTDFDAWFIDEFQDTSPLQLNILERMIGANSCFLVGDPQQSIYLFRGSRSEVFLNKEKQMAESGAEIIRLSRNFRSQQNLLEFFNDFFPKMAADFTTMDPVVDPLESETSVEITHNQNEDDKVEVQNITQQIAQLLGQGASLKDICILTRTRDQLDTIQKELMSRGFPVISHSSANFYRRREILDALSLLKLLINPWDNKNLILFMRSPWMALDDAKIGEILQQEKRKDYWPLFKKYFQNNPGHVAGQVLLKAFADKAEFGVGWTLRRTLIRLGVIDYSFKIDSTGRREANLWKLINLVEKTSREPGASLLQLANDGYQSMSLDDFGDSSDASSPVEPNKIHLMTIHGSKGLQFPYVFIPFLHKKPRDTNYQKVTFDEDRKLWSMRLPLVSHSEFTGDVLEKLHIADLQKRESEEALRVFYVGMTRAENKLFLSWSGKPEKRSWANHLVSYRQWTELPAHIAFNELNASEEKSYLNPMTTVDVRSAYFAKERVLVAPATVAEDFYQPFRDWEQWSQHQRKRWEGIVLHRVFESLKHHDITRVLALAQTWLPTKSDEIVAAVSFVLNNQQVPLQEIIRDGFVEWGYQHQVEMELKERRVDLWGVVNGTLWIVDYKTGSARLKNKAFAQMQEYQVALQQYLNWQGPVQLVAVYPFDQQLFTQ